MKIAQSEKTSVIPAGWLRTVPITLKESNEYVKSFHRHHKPVVGHKFSIAISNGVETVGVCIVGRPIARMADDGFTLEVLRCCTNGVANGCSKLYRSAWACAKALGYRKLITYTLPEEGGASLRGSGFKHVGNAGGGSWSRPSRSRVDDHPLQTKWKWELECNPEL